MLKESILILCLGVISASALPQQEGKAETSRGCGYDFCPAVNTDRTVLNVHLVPHTHDDVGWLKTVDQYYFGNRNRIQKANVQTIIDSVVQSLLFNPARKFVYVESAFFSKWWYEQDEDLQEKVKMLVEEGRLEFINGAWSMNDEATTHYHSLVDQYTWGLKFLNDTFGECGRPRVGWQIDPFGHSREQASLLAQMGFDGFFFARLDYQDKRKRLEDKTMEMVWEASQNIKNSDIFTGALYAHYSPPSGFCFDMLCNDEPINDDPHSADFNTESRINDFAAYVKNQALRFRSNNIMLTMGDDFHYMAAEMWFKNMDKLIKYSNARGDELKINVFYSTPSCYVKALHDHDITWPTKTDDFFPYGSDAHAYWTGYFTSRPTSKRFERLGNHFLQVCKQLTAMAKKQEETFDWNLERLRNIMGVMQHHDAVTGTEKQHVADDYHRSLHASIVACEENTKSSLNQLVTDKMPGATTTQWDFQFNSCLNLNISLCATSENSEKLMVTVYNPLGYETNQYVRFPVGDSAYEVRDAESFSVPSQLVPIPTPLKNLHYRDSQSSNELVFKATGVPAMGYKAFFVTRVVGGASEKVAVLAEPVTIGNDDIQLTFGVNGLLSSITVAGESSEISQNFWYYNGTDQQIRASGAYVFRPQKDAEPVSSDVIVDVVRGDHVDEVHQRFNDWISQVVRLYKTEKYVEFEWMVGPIPIDDDIGKEIVSKFTSSIQSNGEFYTDSNGREMLKRKRSFRETWDYDEQEPIAANYYPINSKIAIEDGTHRLAVLNDRAQGGSSMVDGSVEIMVHRRLLYDDWFGVGEALNETAYGQGLIARGKHWLVFGKKTTQNPSLQGRERILQNQVLLPNWLFFDELTNANSNTNNYAKTNSFIGAELPENIYLMSYEPWHGNNSFLVRFEHILELNEDSELSKSVTLNLTQLFPGDHQFFEVTLGGNQFISDKNRMHFKQEGKAAPGEDETKKLVDGEIFTLEPMEMRTFIITPNSAVNLNISFSVVLLMTFVVFFKNLLF